jgi:hypothetical protein
MATPALWVLNLAHARWMAAEDATLNSDDPPWPHEVDLYTAEILTWAVSLDDLYNETDPLDGYVAARSDTRRHAAPRRGPLSP